VLDLGGNALSPATEVEVGELLAGKRAAGRSGGGV
jgi:hypothetical protein